MLCGEKHSRDPEENFGFVATRNLKEGPGESTYPPSNFKSYMSVVSDAR